MKFFAVEDSKQAIVTSNQVDEDRNCVSDNLQKNSDYDNI